jgi:hypothetical protein
LGFAYGQKSARPIGGMAFAKSPDGTENSAVPVGEYEIANVLRSTCFFENLPKAISNQMPAQVMRAAVTPAPEIIIFVGIFFIVRQTACLRRPKRVLHGRNMP